MTLKQAQAQARQETRVFGLPHTVFRLLPVNEVRQRQIDRTGAYGVSIDPGKIFPPSDYEVLEIVTPDRSK